MRQIDGICYLFNEVAAVGQALLSRSGWSFQVFPPQPYEMIPPVFLQFQLRRVSIGLYSLLLEVFQELQCKHNYQPDNIGIATSSRSFFLSLPTLTWPPCLYCCLSRHTRPRYFGLLSCLMIYSISCGKLGHACQVVHGGWALPSPILGSTAPNRHKALASSPLRWTFLDFARCRFRSHLTWPTQNGYLRVLPLFLCHFRKGD